VGESFMGWLIFFVALAWLVSRTDVNPFLAVPLAIVIAFIGEAVVEIFVRGIISETKKDHEPSEPNAPQTAGASQQTGPVSNIAKIQLESERLLRGPDQDLILGSPWDAGYEEPAGRASHLDLPGFEFWYESYGSNPDLEVRCTKCGFRQIVPSTFVTSQTREEALAQLRGPLGSDPCYYPSFASLSMRRIHDLETAAGEHFEVWHEIGNLQRPPRTELRCRDCGMCMALEGSVAHDSVKSIANEHLRESHSPCSLEEMTLRVGLTLDQGDARIPVDKRRKLETGLDEYRVASRAGDAEQLEQAMHELESAISDAWPDPRAGIRWRDTIPTKV
jgi:hypothetical protein